MTMRSWIRRFFTRPAGHTVRRTPRRFRLALEALEDRCVPSTSPLHSLLHGGRFGTLDQANVTGRANPTGFGPTVVTVPASGAVPSAVAVEVMGAQGTSVPLATPGPTGYTPQQMQTVYGLNQVLFSGIKGDGSGQTIALVDAFDNPSFVNSTDPSFATSALHMFDQTFGLSDPPSFSKVNQSGQAAPLAAPNNSWGPEIALDIEWAHAMAPAAAIILVEANSPSNSDLFAAAAKAGTLASVVSMSWSFAENSAQLSLDSSFQVPGVTFLAATGDSGAPGGYPAYSPHVVAVGGTSLYNLDSNGDYPGTGTTAEVGWSLGSDSFNPTLAGGGGISQFEPKPSFQNLVQSTSFRTIPDISADGDPATGVPIYDPFDTGMANPWSEFGGTSLSTPLMAGMIAMANQGRRLSGGQAFNSDQVLADLYSLGSSNPTDFHDIVHGNNGFAAGAGYDNVTGLGTPNGSQLVPDLAYFGLSSRPTLTSIVVTPSNPSVDEGFTQQFTATGTFAGGLTQNITSSVVWASATPSVATISAAGLATTQAAGTSVITASLNAVTSPGVTLTSLPLVSLAVAPSAPSVPVLLTVQFSVTGTYSDGSTHNFPSTSVAWASATPTVATINTAGLATANSLGTSVITASLYGVTSPGDVLSAVAPSFVVNTTADDLSYTGGKTTLREAILAANAYPGQHTITFDPAVFATAKTINLNLGQLELTDTTGTETITGPAAGVTVNGGELSRVFLLDGLVTASISGLTITGGKSAGYFDGGGVKNYGSLAMTNCTVSGNTAGYSGGVKNLGSLAMTNCTVSGNNGGGVNNYGSLAMTNCTVSGNNNGGVGQYGAATTATLTNCTVSGNYFAVPNFLGSLALNNCTVANSIYSGVSAYGGTTTLGNTIVAGTTSPFGTASDVTGVVISKGNNLIGITGGSSGWLGSDLTGTSAHPLNAVLAPLGNYGGTTQTRPLLPGSPAVNAGSNALIPASVTTDQRGLPRIVNGIVDIGAFESQGFTIALVPGGTPQTATIGTAFANPLAVVVTANSPIEPVNGGVVSFIAHPAASGATAFLVPSLPVITGGLATVAASPNNADGSYQVVASASGLSVSFNLTNVGPVFASLVVNTTSDSLFPGAGLLSLREAVVFADLDTLGKSSITFDKKVFKTPQVINLTGGQLELSNTSETETITGPKAGVTVNGGGLSRVFEVDGLVTASLSGLTIIGGKSASYGGGVQNYGSLTLANCTVSGNSAGQDGGGVANSAALTLTNSTVTANTAILGGGGVFNQSGTTTLTNSNVSGNSVNIANPFSNSSGGGVLNATGSLALTNCSVSGNSASIGGGVTNNGTLTLTNSTVSANIGTHPILGGGGVRNTGTATLTNSTISGNSSSYGGGMYNAFGAKATLANCTVSGNAAIGTFGDGGGGGGLFNYANSTMTLTNCGITGNTASGNIRSIFTAAGGLANSFGSTATLTNCTISNNSSNSSGGGVMNGFGSTLALTNCTLSGNSSSNIGGGLFNRGASFFPQPNMATLTNCTISGNTAVSGGGIANQGSLIVASSTIKQNQAAGAAGGAGIGGGILSDGGSVALSNSTLIGNTATGGAGASGAAGGNGLGGGLALENNATATISKTLFLGNMAQGGAGGAGANGGDGIGGAIAVAIGGASDTSFVSLSNSTLIGNVAQGGDGGAGANGGNGEGGGIYLAGGGSASLTYSIITLNAALDGDGKAGGTDGKGIGGGVYTLGTFTVDAATFINFNFASTSGDNIGP